ncbi:MAG: aspartyl protease family protein [Betaproteobacteria bacterium]
MTLVTRTFVATLCAALATLASAAAPPPPAPDPVAILGAAKAASGGSAWNDLKTQHSKVTLSTGGLTGPVERWSEFSTGRSFLTYSLGPTSGAAGFDGNAGWTQDAAGESRGESARAARELAVNAGYRDQLAFWFPARHPATIVYKDREHRDDADFDVVSITPAGGREFDLWINADTHLIERLVEREASETRTEYYMDFRAVHGLRLPFRVRATRGDPRYDEVVTVDAIDFDAPSKPVNFARPAPPAPDYTFPAGKSEVQLPITLANGHIYVEVRLAGKGPFLMLLDSGGANVLFPQTVQALGLKSAGAIAATGVGDAKSDAGLTRVPSLDLGGIVLANQVFVTLPLDAQFRRIEGMDHVAGLVGYELFKRFPTRIDYVQKRIVFYQPGQWTYRGGGVKVPIQFRDHIPEVEGSIDGVPGVFDIDTGSRSSLTLTAPFAETNKLADKYHATAEVISGAGVGGPARARLARGALLKLGGVDVPGPVTLLSTASSGALADPALAGNVGYGVLHRFNLVFDYRNEAMWFEKNALFDDKDVHDRAGVWVERGKSGIEIVDVLSGGPAAQAGIKSGDLIRSVDGKPVAGLTLDALRTRLKAAPGTKVKLTLASGRAVTLTLRDLV